MRIRIGLVLVAISVMATGFLSSGKDVSGASGSNSKSRAITFSKDVAPILFRECATCHRPGELAPMSLLSYKDARPWAKSIREKVVAREMPPWHADPRYGDFANKRGLSQQQIDTIVAWIEQGAPEGNPKDLPPVPDFTTGWRIGKPDIILSMPKEHTIEPDGPDDYQYIEIPTNFKEDVWVQMAEARPGNPRVVHHIIAFVMPPKPKVSTAFFKPTPKMMEEIQKKVIFYQDGSLMRVKVDAPVFNDGCATPEGGAGIFRDGTGSDDFGMLLCGEAPGRDADAWPVGMAKKIPAGSTLVLQIHYARNGQKETDRSSIGLVLAKQPPDKMVITRPVQNHFFVIPPGAGNHEVTSCFVVKENIHLVSLMPHMHLRGKDMTISAHYPDGRSEVLLSVPRYSFAWQTTYYLKKPVAVPKGTRIQCVAHFDNSDKNKYNPDPAKAVRFGDPTYDEMMIGWLDYTLDDQHLVKSESAGK